MGNKRGASAVAKSENEVDLPSKFMKTTHGRMNEKRLIVILDGAQLEIVKVSGSLGFLSSSPFLILIPSNSRCETPLNCSTATTMATC